eukprot:CAMPEP_0184672734 /NCGR_PEP_ID=MMETSP0308-20130426/86275_1 /TAXON_ID=38269 /ORGANISM="Gloeochaete witrockiana, Strain SAG 46.84" /LENGTH=152 /DNA_ID=CAMNT_0027120117 /DNA_START=886 /DNA_END=1343 /DNA_ORIENTATION=-
MTLVTCGLADVISTRDTRTTFTCVCDTTSPHVYVTAATPGAPPATATPVISSMLMTSPLSEDHFASEQDEEESEVALEVGVVGAIAAGGPGLHREVDCCANVNNGHSWVDDIPHCNLEVCVPGRVMSWQRGMYHRQSLCQGLEDEHAVLNIV